MPEQIGILLLFLVVVLFNLIAGFLSRRRERDARDAETTVAEAPPRSRPAPPRTVTPPPPLHVAPAVPAPMERHRRGISRASDLRRAIVMMTILGPPRALDDERRERAG